MKNIWNLTKVTDPEASRPEPGTPNTGNENHIVVFGTNPNYLRDSNVKLIKDATGVYSNFDVGLNELLYLQVDSNRKNIVSGSQSTFDKFNNFANISNNVIVGVETPSNINTGTNFRYNTIYGTEAGENLTQGEGNTLIGWRAGNTLTNSNNSVLIGQQSGNAYLSTESNNICIQAPGTTGESDTIRLGNSTHNRAFITGVYNVTPPGTTQLMVIDNNNQLGSVATSSFPTVSEYSATISASSPVEFGSTSMLLYKVGRQVTMRLASKTATLSGPVPSIDFSASGTIPLAFRPIAQVYYPMIGYNDGAFDTGLISAVIINPALGTISLRFDLDASPSQWFNNAGFGYDIVVTWLTN